MVILKQKFISSISNEIISFVKLQRSIRLVNELELALIICVLIIQYKMPSLPQAAFAVCKIREQNSRPSKSQDGAGGGFHQPFECLPVKYNEKYMNAIWGHYNRYSPHNIKSNDAAIAISSNGKNLLEAAYAAAAAIQQKPLL